MIALPRSMNPDNNILIYTRYYLHLFIINLVYMFFSAITMLALCILSNSWPK